MRLFIAEKSRVGKAIATCLPGEAEADRNYIKVGDDVVTWCVGHLLETAPPDAYNAEWKSWRLEHLPIFPNQMRLNPIDATKGQLATIKRLLGTADEVVHAGDPGREGQMIVDEVLEYLHNRKPVMRLLLNTVNPGAIKKQLQKLEDNRKFAPLYAAAKCRSESDWLVGMNLSRAATKSIADSETLISIGRVQTPTLALVVNRCLTIEGFVSRTFYDIEARVETHGGEKLVMKHSEGTEERRLWDKEKAQTLVNGAVGQVSILKVSTTRKKVAPPKLHTLASLQGEGSKLYRWSAAETLAMAQELYILGCLTYPRTECLYLPEEQKGDVPHVVAAIGQSSVGDLAKIAQSIKDPQPRSNVFSNRGMEGEEHHAIIPTDKPLPPGIQGKQADLYRLVAMRYLLSLCPDYEHDETQAVLPVGDLQFKARGSIPRVMGWKVHTKAEMKEITLPSMRDGEKARVLAARLVEGKTTPPAYYIEGTLIEDMNGIAKYVEDPRIKAVLNETSGIGTSATQANILETLKKRGYITEDAKGNLMDTTPGRALIQGLPHNLTRPDMTAKWEADLKQVAQGTMPANLFMDGIRGFVRGGVQWFTERRGQVMVTGGNKRPSTPPAKGKGRPSADKGRTTSRTGAPKTKNPRQKKS